jgi:hypothetical protein
MPILMWRKLTIRLLLFFLPILILGAIHIYVGVMVGEIAPFRTIQARQASAERVIYEPDWQRDEFMHFKFQQVLQRQPQVIIIGSSRVIFFRDDFFNLAPDAFYNVSIISAEPWETTQFLRGLADRNALPSVIIVSMDLPLFNDDGHTLSDDRVTNVVPNFFSGFQYLQGASQRVASQWLKSSHVLFEYMEDDTYLGLNASRSQMGYLYDGSYYSPTLHTQRDRRTEPQLTAFANGEGIYEHGSSVRRETMDTVIAMLQIAQNAGVTIIGFLPPYQTEIWDGMMQSGNFTYIDAVLPQLQTLFADYGYPLYDFSDPRTIDATSDELTDTWHPGERLSLRMYLYMLQHQPDMLGAYSDVAYLEEQLTLSDDPYYWFEK